MYRDAIEIVLTQSNGKDLLPNRMVHGYGYDAYFIIAEQEEIQREFQDSGISIVRPLSITDYANKEFVFEDIDGKWVALGNKEN